MGPKPAEKKTKAEIKAEEAVEAERLAAAAEAERVKLEAIRAEKYATDQEARRVLMDECRRAFSKILLTKCTRQQLTFENVCQGRPRRTGGPRGECHLASDQRAPKTAR